MTLTFGPYTIDDAARQLCRGAEAVHLSPKAFDLLALLVQRRPAAISKSAIQDTLWPDTFVSEGNLAVLIKEIRDALGDNARQPTYIRTVQRFGYAFAGAVTEMQRPADPACWLTWGTQRATLVVGENILGRDPTSHVFIDMLGVSRRHAMIAVAGEQVTLSDLGSRNGTFADGQRITATIPLGDDVEILLGPVPVRFRRVAQAGSTLTFDASSFMKKSG